MSDSGADEFVSPMWGRCTGLYLTSEDGTERVAVQEAQAGHWQKIGADIKSYKWSDGDFLLMAHPKSGKLFSSFSNLHIVCSRPTLDTRILDGMGVFTCFGYPR